MDDDDADYMQGSDDEVQIVSPIDDGYDHVSSYLGLWFQLFLWERGGR